MEPVANPTGKKLDRLSVAALIAANSIPLLGVLFFQWELFSVLFLYWLENVVVGLYTVMKMSRATGDEGNYIYSNGKVLRGKRYVIGFFFMHYGLFVFCHGVAVFAIFGPANISAIGVCIAFASLFVSHGISYVRNYIAPKRYLRTSAGTLMMAPYGRLMAMHLIVLAGASIVGTYGRSVIAAAGVVLLKTAADAASHAFEHLVIFRPRKDSNSPAPLQ